MCAASPPVKFGTSARRVSSMLTTIEPENTGPHDDVSLVVDRLGGERLGDGGVGLRVGVLQHDLAAENAAGSVDLLGGELDAVLEVGARGGAGARQLDHVEDLDGLGCASTNELGGGGGGRGKGGGRERGGGGGGGRRGGPGGPGAPPEVPHLQESATADATAMRFI